MKLRWLFLVFLLVCTTALADTKTLEIEGSFSLTCQVPEGYSYSESQVNEDMILCTLTPDEPHEPTILFSVAYSDVDQGRTLNDFTEEEMEREIEIAKAGLDEPEVTISETKYGTKLIVARETGKGDDLLDVSTIYKGYSITLLMYPTLDGIRLTDDMVDKCIDFLSELWIVDM